MTGTTMEEKVYSGVSNLVGNGPLEKAMQVEFDKLGPVVFDSEDTAFAEAIRETLTEDDIAASFQRAGRQTPPDLPLCDFVAPLERSSTGSDGSTDVGDVSWVTPTVQAQLLPALNPFHTWQTVAQGKAPAAHKGMIHAAKVMAATATHLINSPETLQAARDIHNQRQTTTYVCPIPSDQKPPYSRTDI